MSRIAAEITGVPSPFLDHLCACLKGPVSMWRSTLERMLREEAPREGDWTSLESERFRRLMDFPSTPCTEPIRAELSPPFLKRFTHLLPGGHR